ncbi:Serine/threonine-protein kinase AfsK [Streptomyces sp. YIM 130001]|uniref:protein kinase domain-containing protein n=1 Tax=Streptomyces sp. YIM 130001 TaxID=2259644 RepID=UPI000E64BBAD|nr:protein kinase [Streptomyces sp. YIM 130001]RII20766.1 Serine/threonine-protein kinase AfsK [Streptomyces sp. YIM 130001]
MSEPFDPGWFAMSGELRRLGPYRLLGQLATGGMGEIYLGRDPASRRIAALKTVLAPGGVSTEARNRFAREVTLARRVTSRYTARIIDSDTGAERPWMAMEYVPAPSLEALVVQRGALADEQALRRIGAGVVRALKDLHGKSIVHRDIKPLNILLTAEGPKVIDFGISHSSDLTSTRLTLGTIAFAAPEQAEGEPSTSASDIYALGITLYYVACGRLPYPDTQEPLQQLNHVRRGATDLTGLPAGLTGLITDCLELRPERRPTADQLIRRFGSGETGALPAGWSALIARHAEEGARLQRAADESEAETVTRGWTGDGPGHTRRATRDGAGAGAGAGGARGGSGRPGGGGGGPSRPRTGGGPGGSTGRGRPGGPAGPTSAWTPGGVAAAAVAAVVGAVLLASALSNGSDDSGGSNSQAGGSTSTPTYIDDDPTYSPGERPTYTRPTNTGRSDPDLSEADDDPEPTRTRTYRSPTPARPTYRPPPPTYYGAIAVSGEGSIGRAWDYKSRSAAEQAAMNNCSGSTCKILASFNNGCGAVVHNSATRRYSGGYGDSRGEAQRAAMNRAGAGRYITSACTTR